MKVPKGTDIRVDTSGERIKLNIVAEVTTKAEANELATAIKSFANILDGEKRTRKPKIAAVA